MELRQLATFRAIIEAGTFARAADRLEIGPSTVTLHVQQLEADLGGPLFVRQGRQLDLTELGASLRRHADAIALHLDAIGDEAAELAAATRGTLRVGAIEPLAHLDLMPLLTGIARGHAAITLRLDVGGTALLCSSVAEGHLTFAVCSAPPGELGLMFEPLFREPIGLLLPTDHALAHAGDTIPAQRLATQPVLLSEPGCAYRAQILEAFTAIGVSLDIRAEIASTPAAVEAVRAGLGIALLPLAGLDPTPNGTVTRHVYGLELGLNVGIVRPRAGESHSTLTSHVLTTLRETAPNWRRRRTHARPRTGGH